MPRWTYNGIPAYGVIGRIIQVMGPFIDFFRPGFYPCLPSPVLFHAGYSPGGKDTHDLFIRYLFLVFNDNKIYQVVDIRKVVPLPGNDRNLTAKTLVPEIFPDLRQILLVTGKTLHKITVAGPQCSRKTSVFTSNVYDQSALDVGLFKDLTGSRRSAAGIA
jgi:hypothetical protein